MLGLPWWCSVKNASANAGDTVWNHGLRRFHISGATKPTCATTAEPALRAPELQLLRPPTAAPGAWCSRARVLQPEPTTMRSLILTVKLESSPRSLQIERAGFLQPRPSATKDK